MVDGDVSGSVVRRDLYRCRRSIVDTGAGMVEQTADVASVGYRGRYDDALRRTG
jgi:hypothetical protein